ncbi:hypothetical protein ACKI1K_44440, partial [Streptomyces scabiei]|uniref:hypothetical protein n=1 Tax=Streptomyces scabiei TaxID=1930 RepID=UPI0038F6BBED
DSELAKLLQNPISLELLSTEIVEELPEKWMAPLEEVGRGMAERDGLSVPRLEDVLRSASDGGLSTDKARTRRLSEQNHHPSAPQKPTASPDV